MHHWAKFRQSTKMISILLFFNDQTINFRFLRYVDDLKFFGYGCIPTLKEFCNNIVDKLYPVGIELDEVESNCFIGI